ncbi:MAG TPA: hypothetical protein VGM27_09420 [Acidobacteriaceae bacterium]
MRRRIPHGRREADGATRKEIARRLREDRVSPDFIYAFERTGHIVTEENRDLWTAKARREWNGALRDYRRRVESRAIDFCFTCTTNPVDPT